MISERDAFDTLLDHAPDKLNVVKTVKYIRFHSDMYSMFKYTFFMELNEPP